MFINYNKLNKPVDGLIIFKNTIELFDDYRFLVPEICNIIEDFYIFFQCIKNLKPVNQFVPLKQLNHMFFIYRFLSYFCTFINGLYNIIITF